MKGGAGEAGEMQTHGDERRERGIESRPSRTSCRQPSCCCQFQADRPDLAGLCQAAALMKCFREMRKTELTAASEVVLAMIARRVFWG